MFIHGVMVSDLKHKCFQNCEVKTMIDNITMNGPKMVSLFSGCGGLDCGFMRAGFNVIWANDFDSDAQAVYRLNLGEIDGRDIMTVNADEIPDCDITGGGCMILVVCCIKNVCVSSKRKCQKLLFLRMLEVSYQQSISMVGIWRKLLYPTFQQ